MHPSRIDSSPSFRTRHTCSIIFIEPCFGKKMMRGRFSLDMASSFAVSSSFFVPFSEHGLFAQNRRFSWTGAVLVLALVMKFGWCGLGLSLCVLGWLDDFDGCSVDCGSVCLHCGSHCGICGCKDLSFF